MRNKTPNTEASRAERFQRVEELFHSARGLDPADRGSLLDEACEGDLLLRREVESLLLHSEQATSDVQIPRPDDESKIIDRGPISEGPGTRIGPYKILQQIGEGGFGVVYMAEQEHPVRRKVALKIIKLGMDTKQVIARFEAERQALALMDHPNIAKVLDAGATETGRPYFVMELVRGIPIIQYCDEQRLNTADRLELFLHTCYAIAHAHQKGIIHRDIKPSNVLVTLHDDIAVPKVIDFGIAKATSSRLTEKTLFTEFRQFIGTPEYMSPDQADISGLDIDTRTDIYSLGVLLFELLTGTTPLDSQTLRSSDYADIQRIIREVEPPLPSTRVSALGRRQTPKGDGGNAQPTHTASSLQDIARHRRVEPSGLLRMLRGDLDWIVMKAMEKDRTRRYQTANELAADIKRYVNDEPVLAGPPSASYAMRKFIRRHKVAVIVTLLMAATVLIGLSLASVGFVRASREAAQNRRVGDFLQSLIIDTEGTAARDLSVDEIVDRGRDLFGDDHAIVGNLLTTRASSLATAGRLDEAVAAQREALAFLTDAHGPDHPSVAGATARLAELLEERRDITEAEQLYRTALELKRQIFGQRSKSIADALESLTSLLVETGSQTVHDEVKVLWKETVDAYEDAIGPNEPITVRQLCEMTVWLQNHGYSAEAAEILPDAVERARSVLAKDDMIRFVTINAYGQNKVITGDYAGVIPIIEELIEMSRLIWKDEFTVELAVTHQLVNFNVIAGDRTAAEKALERIIEIRETKETPPNYISLQLGTHVLRIMEDWFDQNPDKGRVFVMGLAREVRGLYQEGSENRRESIGSCARWFFNHEYYEDAAQFLAESLAGYRSADDPDRADLARVLIYLGDSLVHLERCAEAEPYIRESIEIRSLVLEEDDRWLITNAQSVLGASLAGQKRFDEAEPLLLESYEKLNSSILVPATNQRLARDRLIDLYETWGKPDQAAKYQDTSAPTDPTLSP